MNQDFAESVARFRADLASAVTRSRRAAAEARADSAALRREIQRAAEDTEKGAPKPGPPSDPDDDDFSDHQILMRP